MKITKSQLKQIIKEELETVINESEEGFSRRKFLQRAGKFATAVGAAAVLGYIKPSEAATDSPEYRKSFEKTAGVYNKIRHQMFDLEQALSELQAVDLSHKVASFRDDDDKWASIGKEITKVLESIY
tara:strand:+ start:204 stop:584 length:381 start_codon:yes stop_codon:yes gene_type:complete